VSALITQMRLALRARNYSRRTEQTYCQWARRSIRFHALRHPTEMGEGEINAFFHSPRRGRARQRLDPA
jgi:hypothetical protein